MKELCISDFEKYLQCLRELAGFPTVFTQPDQVENAMRWCQSYFSQRLNGYRIYRDQKRNLIARPEVIDLERDIIYLSAHIDTVNADLSEWDEPFTPFSLYEDDIQMVARGVSDCKAGVAFELFLIELAHMQKISLSNIIFTITFKEEGAGEKTSIQIGEELGSNLPISKRDTIFIVLENTVTVTAPPTLSFYTSERGNFVIRVSDTLGRLCELLSHLKEWNPVSIHPEIEFLSNQKASILNQKGGHVCSISRENNLLTQIIEQSSATDILLAGDKSGFSVIPSKIYKQSVLDSEAPPVVHHLILSNRSFDTLEDVHGQLRGILYEEVKDFSISQGMNFDLRFLKHPLSTLLKTYHGKKIVVEQTYNIGVSDATIVTNSMDEEFRKRFYPLVMGPGTRSQRRTLLPRLTHGKNETFDKQSGKAAVECILSVLIQLGAVTPGKQQL